MGIDDLTVREAREIAKMFNPPTSVTNIVAEDGWTFGHGRAVIVRAKDAGVHFGRLVKWKDRVVILERSRRLWSWHAAKDGSLSGVAVHGLVAANSKVACEIPGELAILDACEIIDCSADAAVSIMAATW